MSSNLAPLNLSYHAHWAAEKAYLCEHLCFQTSHCLEHCKDLHCHTFCDFGKGTTVCCYNSASDLSHECPKELCTCPIKYKKNLMDKQFLHVYAIYKLTNINVSFSARLPPLGIWPSVRWHQQLTQTTTFLQHLSLWLCPLWREFLSVTWNQVIRLCQQKQILVVEWCKCL